MSNRSSYNENVSGVMSQRVSPMVRKVAWVWLAWTVAGLFYITQDSVPRMYRNETVPWPQLFVGWMVAMYICAAFTPAILWAGRRWPLEHQRRWTHAAIHLFFGAVFSVVSNAIEAPALMAFGVFPSAQPLSLTESFARLLAYGFHGGVVRYWVVIGLQLAIRSHQNTLDLKVRSSELAGQLTAARLSALKMQLQPHFLFNTLGTIMVLVQQQRSKEAEAMLARLSDLLRLAVDDVNTQEVPLWHELEFLRLYLSIEEVRFRDRLQIRIAAAPDASDAFVPHMILQPIVENAIRHGLGQSEEAVTVDVTAGRSDADGDGGGALVLTVADDGPGAGSGGPGPLIRRKGIGLTNTENRLKALYGDGATLAAEHRVPRGVQVTVTLPFRTERPEEA
jgi:two-component system LytT family sensor kinase